MDTVTIAIVVFCINLIIATINHIFPFMNYKDDDDTFETVSLILLGSFIIVGIGIGWFLRLFMKKDS